MKRTITLLIATALIFGMSQCKKNVETITPSNLGEAVHITVNVDDGGKHEVYPGTGAYVFANGDELYVGNNGRYIGMLTYNNGAFSGLISSPSTDDYLHFYFVGGLTPSETPSAGSTKSFTVSIANQSGNLPVLSYAHSTQKYVDGKTTYGCTLLNKCALVEFELTQSTNEAVNVADMLTVANISFANPDNAISSTGTKDVITLNSQSETSKWAILLPQDAVTKAAVTIGSEEYKVNVPAITTNAYLTGSTAVTIDNTTPTTESLFTVGDNGNVVRFSPGNLQYNAHETDKWRFAEHQWDICQTTSGDWITTGWVDLFGWGTWGEGKDPLDTSNNSDSYQWSTDFQGELDGRNDWRTLTTTEWQYLFESRDNASNLYGCATVNGRNGLVVLPDNWTLPSGLTFTPGLNRWDNNEYNDSQWGTMEEYGAVFLPAAGQRDYTLGPPATEVVLVQGIGVFGNYWSSTIDPDSSSGAYRVSFTQSYSYPWWDKNSYYRCIGMSVRLVY